MDFIFSAQITMTILDREVSLQQNLFYALQKYRIFWFILLLTATLDYVTTLQFMIKDSIALEANLVVRYLAYEFGIFAGVLIGKLLQIFSAMAFCALSKELSRAVLLLIILLNCAAIYINTAFS
ncbi:hypothetical protein RI844_15025 [Thalassotalea fonticola]|uniref:DUF5658 domain-containing protein n=1 Tax=Thalassotalea fonticola TaxID=3065649 RepID=A0ABZ0GL89_9GAMM|nr:hypothetical protein RI844_15025 [Colwelliaceae bacterium S1-1]